jgi:hypothetical protein
MKLKSVSKWNVWGWRSENGVYLMMVFWSLLGLDLKDEKRNENCKVFWGNGVKKESNVSVKREREKREDDG